MENVQVLVLQIPVRFVFTTSAGNWHMNQVEVDFMGNMTTLSAVKDYPSGKWFDESCWKLFFIQISFAAPNGLSYACGGSFLFKKGNFELEISKIQV